MIRLGGFQTWLLCGELHLQDFTIIIIIMIIVIIVIIMVIIVIIMVIPHQNPVLDKNSYNVLSFDFHFLECWSPDWAALKTMKVVVHHIHPIINHCLVQGGPPAVLSWSIRHLTVA